MTPAAFTAWLAAMKAAGLARSDAHCGRLLGKSADTVVRMKRDGADKTVLLACRALMQRLHEFRQPWE